MPDPDPPVTAPSVRLAEEIAEILAAQNLDDVDVYRPVAAQIVLMLMVTGWKFTQELSCPPPGIA